MSEVKRFRADHRHVVETEFDDAQFVSVADYDALQQRMTVAEKRAAMLKELLRDCVNEFSTSEASQFELEMRNMILAALKPDEAAAPIDDQCEK